MDAGNGSHVSAPQTAAESDTPLQHDTVFLTGCTGFIGRLVLRKLLLAGAHVVVAIRGRRGQGATDRWLQMSQEDDAFCELPIERVQVIEADLLDPEFFESPVLEHVQTRITRIVHVAASVNMHETLETALTNNLLPGIRLYQWAQKCPLCTHVVITSTAFVSPPSDTPVPEEPCPAIQGVLPVLPLNHLRGLVVHAVLAE